jgi:hypothetical protein
VRTITIPPEVARRPEWHGRPPGSLSVVRPGWLPAGVAGLALLAAACGGGGGGAGGTEPGGAGAPSGVDRGTPAPVAQVAASPAEDVPSALDDAGHGDFPEPLVDPDDLVAGGPPPDGIPSIDDPRFLRADEVGFLADTEPVLALEVGGEARAYPVQVMIWHEIVNDTVGGVPVAVTYCPLCNSAVAYDRRLGDRVLELGTSGMLYNSALVMYDRQTESLWGHFTGDAIIGHLAGERLDVFPMSTVSWADWRDAHPDGLVLSRETGFERDYGRNPYPGYDEVDSSPFLFDGEVDGRLAAMERVVGIARDGRAVAVRLDELADRGVMEVDLAGSRVVVWVRPGTVSALDATSVAEGREVGATGVFVPVAGDRELSFERDGDEIVDAETGTRWDVLGRAVDGPLAGTTLEPVAHVDTFWFAWAAFQPDTEIVP